MIDYLGNRWVKIGLALVVLGWGPLIAIIVQIGRASCRERVYVLV